MEKVDTYAANECQVIDVMSIKEEEKEDVSYVPYVVCMYVGRYFRIF